MSNAIKLSVIIPIYNVEKYLRQCLDSVLAQTLENIEIILIDDGSKDSCPKIIDEYATKDSRIRVFHNTNCGYGKECNFGINNANGEYIAILEPDDYIETTMYDDLYNLAKTHNADIVKSSYFKNLETNEKIKIIKIDWSERFNLPNTVFQIKDYPQFLALHPSIWSAIYKKDFLVKNNIRFIEAPGAGWTDNPFQIETFCLTNRIFYTDTAYYHWRCKVTDDAEDIKDYTIPFKRCDEIYEWIKSHKITDKNILAAIYEKELSYINILIRVKSIPDLKDFERRIRNTCSRMDKNIIKESNIIRKQNKKLYFICTKCFPLVLLMRLKKKIFSLKLNKHEQSLYIFGKKFKFNN